MSDASHSESQSSRPDPKQFPAIRALRPQRLVFFCALVAAVCLLGYAAIGAKQDRDHLRESEEGLLRWHGMLRPAGKHLAAEYSDVNGLLLADPPKDPSQQLDPETLVLAHYVDVEVDTQLVDWDGLRTHLAETTGKQVVCQEYWNEADDVADVNAGKIQIVALHAADAPHLVNSAGFIPVANLGTEVGPDGNQLVIAVSSESKFQSIAELRGQQLTCTRPDSITGYRAAIAVLLRETGLRPSVDYKIAWSYGQKQSIRSLAKGECTFAALSNDKIQSMLNDGSITTSDYRVVYRSQKIPRLSIGYTHKLQPALAAKVQAAVLNFENAGGAGDESTGRPMRFFAVDYKKDFEFMRSIDDSFDPRFGGRAKAKLRANATAENEVAP